ncbi:phosphate acyltransferase PlsX [Elongatibacter sediminis]|uniref:Phosphate acyltransferase n=1 Tax=Elongatibacter sediminis TaxID=3119006 RepID=A0AAW9R7D9_9GAMM
MTAADPAMLAIDAHGGDHGVVVTVPAAVAALRTDTRLQAVLVGREPEIRQALASCRQAPSDRIQIRHAEDILPMDAGPATALRRGRKSSMWLALQMVADGSAGACVSGGGTGALMALGVKQVGLLPGLQRPALMAWVPLPHCRTAMLDLGANLHVSARQLVQFAVMGAVTAETADRVENPRVGLLNVGHEDGKGHEAVREAHAALKELRLNYVGFVEGHDIYSGNVDVAVCDGFSGNLILKASEGLARMLVNEFRNALSSSLASRLGALLAGPAIRRALAPLDPAEHNGAPLLGLKRVVVKSHGGADCRAMTRAILEAGREARRGVPDRIEASMQAFQLETEA